MSEFIFSLIMMYLSVTVPVYSEVTVSDHVYETDAGSVVVTVPQPPAPAETPVPAPEPPVDVKPFNYIQELKNLGYLRNETSDQNLNIRNGVLRFQAANNLIADGIYGPKTEAALKQRIKEKVFYYTDAIDTPASKGKWILINKTKRILTLYEGYNVIEKYPVAVGRDPEATPEGKHWVVVKVVNPDWGGAGIHEPVKGGTPENPLGYRWIGLNLGGGGEYGIHGNNSPYSIGTNASLGCVRMINPDVEELFKIIPIGAPVWIATESTMDSMGIGQKAFLDLY